MARYGVIASVIALYAPVTATAAVYDCPVSSKFDRTQVYTQKQLDSSQFSVRINDNSDPVIISRCSFAKSAGRVTCDDYEVDLIHVDQHINSKKFYYFRGQFDVQLFGNLNFVENNGRGSIAYGTCQITIP